MPAQVLSSKGRQTQPAFEQAARKLFAWKKTLYGF